ncbi:predicted protein [Nematostella vectensis]|uniref:G-protein coupled receptors family 1 profile domain-containing protein n=1 Tax=Nematostella vectensis TaxID=45351 RepID=A7SPL3_NEMVE|nr:predicted protein [Nematostella vectensis]|eukprot:XP_001626425.1 predicted protein [Nematostella vectensis]
MATGEQNFNRTLGNESLSHIALSENSTNLIRMYRRVEFVCAVLMVLLAPITVITNGVLLVTIWKDPLKCLRKVPTTLFIIGLSFADLMTGIVVEPAFIFHYFSCYLDKKTDLSKALFIIASNISSIAISVSYVIVLAMSASQYIAITRPHRYKQIITRPIVLVVVVASTGYFLAFSMIQFAGVSRSSFHLLGVIMHPTLISICLVVLHILMRRAFKQRVRTPARRRTLPQWSLREGEPGSHGSRISFHFASSGSPIISKERATRLMRSPRNHEEQGTTPGNFDPTTPVSVTTKHSPGKHRHENVRVTIEEKEKALHESFIGIPSVSGQDGIVNSHKRSKLEKDPEPQTKMHLGNIRRRKPEVEKQFAIVAMYLTAILLFTCIPHITIFKVFDMWCLREYVAACIAYVEKRRFSHIYLGQQLN